MPKRKTITVLFILCWILFCSVSIYAQKTSSDKILFTSLLDSLSKKYNVYFTYNSTVFDKKKIDVKFLNSKTLDKTIQLLEIDTSYYFDDLGNNYFVVYTKSPKKKKAFNNYTYQNNIQLEEVVITGNRTKPRTILDSPIPIDNLYIKELKNSGKKTIEEMLTYKVPSFNSQNQAISDATAHYDPADLRGLGPSRLLVLINGKRKNQSAQMYLNRTPGKGEVGVDLKSIPLAAIERVEILRDGASAQYGSDAIAGVINFILKKNVPYSTFNTSIGITSKKDGFFLSTDYNGSYMFKNGGFINFTLGYYNQKNTNRAGSPGVLDLPNNPLPNWVYWAKNNPKLGMHVGQPDLEKKSFSVNIEHPIGKATTFYSFHNYTNRNGRSFAFYRAPYWRQTTVGDYGVLSRPEDFMGYQPTFNTNIYDYMSVFGLKYRFNNTWLADGSITYGANSVLYKVNNSINRDYLKDHGSSPTSFDPGRYKLNNTIINFDVTGQYSEFISLALGFEYKNEGFTAYEGDPFSYYKSGSDSFAGIKPNEAGKWERNNIAGYLQIDYDINNKFLIGIANRYEKFSGFGSNFSWKIDSRYKLGEKGVIRGSFSTGFRAPTLHQRHLTSSQYIHASNSLTPRLQRTLSNNNPAVKALGVPNLFAESSINLSAGLTYKFNSNFSTSIDFYNIKVKNRVLFSSQIGYKNGSPSNITNPVEQILKDNNVETMQFFINAGDTKTTGVDFLLNYKQINLNSNNKLLINLAVNFNTTTIHTITTPNILANAGYTIFDRQEKGLITSSRPKSKFILGLNYTTKNWNLSLNNTRFGKVIITAPQSGGVDQELNPKIATDFGLNYKLSSEIILMANINNIFNIYPDKTLKTTNTTEAGNRLIYSSEVQQLGLLGTNFNFRIRYLFK
ncbi:Colicin I receptor [Polaribacter huanghezhanensis]|uniref:TonB-dependent receptor plug domain-containing protein n=1 Tax=Polaribacter huanghezhanensis TaxID=1354726 RepID=UPI0026484849|nr:TonB-dependent receptor [Polaribacter huanghezhanensis]WKD86556.1 Colicin I receptor [Polaribacter huanghezhanensis]